VNQIRSQFVPGTSPGTLKDKDRNRRYTSIHNNIQNYTTVFTGVYFLTFLFSLQLMYRFLFFEWQFLGEPKSSFAQCRA